MLSSWLHSGASGLSLEVDHFKGTSAVAQCLYGFSNAPISATISVSEDNGEENIASTSVTDQGGWLHLAAYGFTFSNPVISVKLTQSARTKKIVTLHCVRGKTKKSVTGTSPKCPAGFKRV
jgi:hypothetical protein